MHVVRRPMDAAELARWTRFAAKGGIGKCTATGDCVAEAAEDLMFLKNDEIVVLMQLPDEDTMFLGYCEGIVGRFRASDVQFHSKLKKPVMTKRSSVSAASISGKNTPTPSLAQSPMPPSPKSDGGHQTFPSPLRPSPSPSLSYSSSREQLPRSTSHSSTAASLPHSASTSTSMSTSMSLSSLSSVVADTPTTFSSSPEPLVGKPLNSSGSTASMDTNISGRSSTYLASSSSSMNGSEGDGGEDTDTSAGRNRKSETAAVEMWPTSPSSTLTRKPVNSSRLAFSTQPVESEESGGEHDRENSSDEYRYDPDDGGWANMPGLGETVPLRVVKLNSPNSVPPSPYQPFHSSSSLQTDGQSVQLRSPLYSEGGSIHSPNEMDSASEYDTTDPEDPDDETTKFPVPPERKSVSPSFNSEYSQNRHSTNSDSAESQSLSRTPSTHHGNASSSLIHENMTRSSVAAPSFYGSEDGEVGIGLSLLQGLVAGDDEASDEDEAPSPKREKSRQSVGSVTRSLPPNADDWDGASIYENYYRLSRFSVNPRSSSSTSASTSGPKMSTRSSHSSQRGAPVEVVPPVPVDPRSGPESSNRSAKTHSVDSDASVYTQASASKVLSTDPKGLSAQSLKSSLRPAPLDLVNGIDEPSPLLHTRWGSPVSSASPPPSSAGQTSFFEIGSGPASASSGNISPGGAASILRQRLELERGSPAGSNYTELDTHDGDGMGSRIVVEDDEEPPVVPMVTDELRSESPEIDYETDMDIEGDLVETKPRLNLVTNDSLSPPSANSTTPTSTAPSTASQSPSSSGAITPLSPSSPPDISPPPQPAPLQSLHQPRPSLSELRGYQTPDLDKPAQRTSLFLPHPNAPKPPPPTGAPEGPMYIRSPPPPSQQRSESVINIINMSVGRSTVTRVRPTIYGRTDGDLGSATGPVRMVFSIDPPPPPVPLPSQIPFRSAASPAPASRRAASDSDGSLGGGSSSGSPAASHRGPVAPGRSSSSAVPPVSTASNNSFSPTSERPADPRSAVLQRPNFVAKAGTSRPRSRSFSGFKTTQVSSPIPTSREEGSILVKAPIVQMSSRSTPIIGTPTSSPPSLSPLPPSSPSPPNTLSNNASRSSLRSAHAPSPLSLPHNNSVLGVRPGLRSPTSPLALSPVAGSSSSPAVQARPLHQLRQMASRSTLNEGSHAHRPPSLSRTAAIDSPTASSVHTRNDSMLSSSPSLEVDSNHVSPTGTRESVRHKLSLPNLRRNQSRQSTDSGSQNETMQIQDMDFELIRPNLAQLQQASGRSSEDSSLGIREASGDGRSSNIGDAHRGTDSPALSMSSNQATWSSSDVSIDAHRQRELKWMTLMGVVPPAQAKKSKKVRKLLMDGSVPSSVRFLVWSHLTDGKAKAKPGVYTHFGQRARVAAQNDIERDVQRCFSNHPHLQSNRSSLVTLLQAYLTMVPDVQYSKGLTLIAGHLLALSPEEDAFWIFASIMDSYLRPYFSSTTTWLEVDAALFSRALEANDAQVAKKVLVDMSINPVELCRPWFSTLFVDALPLDYLNRVWDLFLFEGIPFLFRIGLVLFHCCRRRVLEAINQDELFDVLEHPSPSWLPQSPDALISLAFSFKLKDDDVRKQRVKMEAQVKRQTQVPRANSAAGRSVSVPRN